MSQSTQSYILKLNTKMIANGLASSSLQNPTPRIIGPEPQNDRSAPGNSRFHVRANGGFDDEALFQLHNMPNRGNLINVSFYKLSWRGVQIPVELSFRILTCSIFRQSGNWAYHSLS